MKTKEEIIIADKHPYPKSRNWNNYPGIDQIMLSFEHKEECNLKGMYAFVSWSWVNPLAEWIGERKVLEVMAGRGWLTHALKEKGIDIIATDDYSWFSRHADKEKHWSDPVTEVEKIDAVEAVKKYGATTDVLIISWPYMDNNAYQVIKALHEVNPKALIVYIGEGTEGCTADNEFFEHFEKIQDPVFDKVDAGFHTWWGIHDHPQLGKYKA